MTSFLIHGFGSPSIVIDGFGGPSINNGEYSTDFSQTTITPALVIAAGNDGEWTVTLADSLSERPTGLTTSFGLTAELWAGGTSPVLSTPAATWINASQGTILLKLAGTDTASLTPGRYKIRLKISTPDGLSLSVPDREIKVLASPASSGALPVYCEYADLLLYAPWLENEEDPDTDETGYLKQRSQARAHFDRFILSHASSYQSYAGFNNFSYGFLYSSQGTNAYIYNLLAQNKLVVTPQVVEITARYSIGLIADSMILPTDNTSGYHQIAARMFVMANGLMLSFVAEFDVNNNGQPPYYSVPCNSLNTRYPTPTSSWGCSR